MAGAAFGRRGESLVAVLGEQDMPSSSEQLRLAAESYLLEECLVDSSDTRPDREEHLKQLAAAKEALRRAVRAEPPAAAPPFRRILVATDGSFEAQRAERLAAGLAPAQDGRIMLVCVADTRWAAGTDRLEFYVHDVHEGLLRQAARTMTEAVGRVPPGVLAEHQVREGEPAAEIVKAAREWRADLIVTGTRGRGRLRCLLLGSTTQGILHAAQCPVLAVVPERGEACPV